MATDKRIQCAEKDFQNFLDLIKYIKPYCLNNVKKSIITNYADSDGVNILITTFDISITIYLDPANIEKVKNLPEYKLWYKDAKDRYEDFLIRKSAKKYNL